MQLNLAGFSDEGVTINAEKTKLSFDCSASVGGIDGRTPASCESLLPRRLVHDGAGNVFLPWCGLLINTATLDIQVWTPFLQCVPSLTELLAVEATIFEWICDPKRLVKHQRKSGQSYPAEGVILTLLFDPLLGLKLLPRSLLIAFETSGPSFPAAMILRCLIQASGSGSISSIEED